VGFPVLREDIGDWDGEGGKFRLTFLVLLWIVWISILGYPVISGKPNEGIKANGVKFKIDEDIYATGYIILKDILKSKVQK